MTSTTDNLVWALEAIEHELPVCASKMCLCNQGRWPICARGFAVWAVDKVPEYRRRISGVTARNLIWMSKQGHGAKIKLGPRFGTGRDESRLVHWGLLEEVPGPPRQDGNPHTGYYYVTARGHRFAAGQLAVPMYVYVQNGKPVRESGAKVLISHCFRTQFDYSELKHA